MAKYVGETNENVEHGGDYSLMTQDMVGKIYKPGKDSEGHWLDKVGEPDTRIMVWVGFYGNQFYKVYNTGEDVLKDWHIEGNFNHYSPRIREAITKQLVTV